MLDQLTALVKQFGENSVVKNSSVPNEHNENVLQDTTTSIFEGLKNSVSSGNLSDLGALLQGNNAIASSPIVKNIMEQLSGKMSANYGIGSSESNVVASELVPKVLESLIGKAKNPNDNSIQIEDIVGAISNGNASGLMETISKYGGVFGLDQDGDGKINMSDVTAAVTKKSGGLGGLLGRLFGK